MPRGIGPEYSSLSVKLRAFSTPGEGGCRLWLRALGGGGYPLVNWHGKRLLACRVSLSLKLGRPLLAGMYACHARECPNKHCIEPSHLYEGTARENKADDLALGRIQQGEVHHRAKLTDSDVRQIRAAEGTLKEIGKRFAISEGHVSEIKHRKKWAHLR